MTAVAEKIHALITGSTMAETKDLSGRHFLVTGCAEGSLGFATARQLLEQGGIVSITVRNNNATLVAALQQQIPPQFQDNIYGFDVDLSQRDSVEAFVSAYQQAGLPLDVLINNAGIHFDLMSKWTAPQLSADGFEIQWRVNYLGTAHLTLCLLPLLQASAKNSADSRVINVVSQLHSKGLNREFFEPQRAYNSWDAYGQSKLALVHFSRSIAKRFADQGISSYSLHPGSVYTNVASKGLEDTGFIEKVRNLMAPLEKLFLKTAKEGAQTQIYCATADKEQLQSGKYYRDLVLSDESPEALDAEVGDRLWDALEVWVN